jgi:hypothetical protein
MYIPIFILGGTQTTTLKDKNFSKKLQSNDYVRKKVPKVEVERNQTDRQKTKETETYMLCEMNLLRATLVIPLLLKLSNMLDE